jgi:hypothetical protein
MELKFKCSMCNRYHGKGQCAQAFPIAENNTNSLCKLCNKPGHFASKCALRHKPSYQNRSGTKNQVFALEDGEIYEDEDGVAPEEATDLGEEQFAPDTADQDSPPEPDSSLEQDDCDDNNVFVVDEAMNVKLKIGNASYDAKADSGFNAESFDIIVSSSMFNKIMEEAKKQRIHHRPLPPTTGKGPGGIFHAQRAEIQATLQGSHGRFEGKLILGVNNHVGSTIYTSWTLCKRLL